MEYLDKHELKERPFLKDVIDEIVEDIQHARLREAVLRLDTFGQTQMVNGRIEVTINSRIAEMPGVKDAAGVAYVSKWHESWHVEHDIEAGTAEAHRLQPLLPGLVANAPGSSCAGGLVWWSRQKLSESSRRRMLPSQQRLLVPIYTGAHHFFASKGLLPTAVNCHLHHGSFCMIQPGKSE